MPRYEGMDDLLEQVRARLGVLDPVPRTEDDATELGQHFEAALEIVLLLVRDAGQLREQLGSGKVDRLTSEEREEIRSLIGKALRELWSCKALLERTPDS